MLSASAPTNLASSVSSSNGVSANDANVQGTPREDAGGASHPAVLDAFSINPSSLLSAGDLPHPTIAVTPPPTAATTNPTQQGSSKLLGTLTKAAKNSALPTAICAYYLNSVKGIGQGCLRVNCKFFHGTEEQLAELRKKHKRLKSPGGSSNCSTRSASSTVSGDGKKEKSAADVPTRLKMVKDTELGNKRPIVCLNYLTDTCHRPGCRFLHLPPNVRPLPMTVCDYFAAGTCTRKRCRFFHGTQEVLSRMHARGVTMYNPITNEAHDPSASLEELMRLQERTTVPLSAAAPQPLPPQRHQGACLVAGQQFLDNALPTAQYSDVQFIAPPQTNYPTSMQHPLQQGQLMTRSHFVHGSAQPRYADPTSAHLTQPQVINVITQPPPLAQHYTAQDYAAASSRAPTTIIIQQGTGYHQPPPAGAFQGPMMGHSTATIPNQAIASLPEGLLSAIMRQHPGATIITTAGPPNSSLGGAVNAAPQAAGQPFYGGNSDYQPLGAYQWGMFE